jgi:UDP-GlcNAc:undecaprenyl-phosphate GlcNAc-1-phosphate transferase
MRAGRVERTGTGLYNARCAAQPVFFEDIRPIMLPFLVFLLAAAMTTSLAVSYAMRRISLWLGLVSHPGGHRTHDQPMPMGGGVGIFLGAWAPIVLGLAVCWYLSRRTTLPGWADLTVHIRGALTVAPRLGIIFIGGLIIWLTGLADDRWRVSPWIRLAIEAGVALILVASGKTVSIFIESGWLRAVLTVLWVVGIINAFNMLDNMDGLCGGVSVIISMFFTIVAVQTGHYFVAAFLCCLTGAIGGFLLFNFPPARIFMGDSGSTTIGYMLAVMTLEFTFYQPGTPYFPIVMPIMMFAVPLFDMLTVVWIRVRAGRSPFRGDTNHFSHRLVALGMSRRQAVLTIYLITATVALGATVLYYAAPAAILVIFAQTVAIFAIIGVLESARPQTPRE